MRYGFCFSEDSAELMGVGVFGHEVFSSGDECFDLGPRFFIDLIGSVSVSVSASASVADV